MPNQQSNNPDGKTFRAKAPEKSPEFGVHQRDAEVARGGVPGSAQDPCYQPDPSKNSYLSFAAGCASRAFS